MTDAIDPPGEAPAPMQPAAAVAAPRLWNRVWFPYALCLALGLILGVGIAIKSVRAGALGSGDRIGAWETGRDFGTAEQSAKTRAVVALRGLLALPAAEARYYTARFDDGGQPLTSNCTYRVTGGALATKFWTVTLYDAEGYLIANPAGLFSVANMALPADEQARWTIIVSPTQQAGHWLPTGAEPTTAAKPIALTLRAYLPADGGQGDFTASQLPSIRKEGCA